MNPETVAVVGASTNRAKYGNIAVRAYRDAGFTVYPINPRATTIEGLPAYPSLDTLPVDCLDRVSLYVPPAIAVQVLEQVAKRPVREIWLNPGTDSPEVLARADELGLNVIRACSLVAMGAR